MRAPTAAQTEDAAGSFVKQFLQDSGAVGAECLSQLPQITLGIFGVSLYLQWAARLWWDFTIFLYTCNCCVVRNLQGISWVRPVVNTLGSQKTKALGVYQVCFLPVWQPVKSLQNHGETFWTGYVRFLVEKVKNAVGDSMVAPSRWIQLEQFKARSSNLPCLA